MHAQKWVRDVGSGMQRKGLMSSGLKLVTVAEKPWACRHEHFGRKLEEGVGNVVV